MPLKPTPKTPQQLEELVELLRESQAGRKTCPCIKCQIDDMLYQATTDGLLFALGKPTKDFVRLMRRLQRNHAAKTEDHCSHSE